jgi:hypothetical protein
MPQEAQGERVWVRVPLKYRKAHPLSHCNHAPPGASPPKNRFEMVSFRAASLIHPQRGEKIPGELTAARLRGSVLGTKIVGNFSR